MAALSTEVKVFIVHALACLDTPSPVVKVAQEEYGLIIICQQVESQDPL